MKPLRITHINTHDAAGGAAKVAWRLALAQREAGHDACIVSRHVRQDLPAEGSPPRHAFDPAPHRALERACSAQGLLYQHFQGSHRLVDDPLVAGADLVHLHNLHGDYFNPLSLVPLSHARPTLWTLHDMQAITGRCAHSFECAGWARDCKDCPHPETYPQTGVDSAHLLLGQKASIAAMSRVALAVPSLWLLRKVEQSILAHLPRRHIPNFCPTRVFVPSPRQAARQRFGLPEDAMLVGASAHGGPLENVWKGGDHSRQAILALLERNPAIRFVNIGASGPSPYPWLINVPHQEDESALAAALSALDLFLYTSVADNCPLVVIEALACGLPMATFGTGGVPELVRHGLDGWVAEPGDVAGLVQGAWELLSDASRREACARAARAGAVQRFDTAVALAAYASLAEEAMQAHRHAQARPARLVLGRLPRMALSTDFLAVVQGLEQGGLVRATGRWPRAFPRADELAMEPLCSHAEACLRCGQPARALDFFAEAVRRNPFEPRGFAGFCRAARALGLPDAPTLRTSPEAWPYPGRVAAAALACELTGRAPAREDAPAADVSLLLPTRDRQPELRRMLGSIAAAAPGLCCEVLMLADARHAGVAAVAREHGARFFDEAWLFAGRPSWPAMMNYLLWQARGELFMFASDDISFEPEAITLAREALLHQGAGELAGAAMAYRNEGAEGDFGRFGIDLTLGHMPLINYGLLKSELARRLGGFCQSYRFYCADGDLCLRLYRLGYGIAPVHKARVRHHHLLDTLKQSNLGHADADIALYRRMWAKHYFDITEPRRLFDDTPGQVVRGGGQ